MTKVTVQDVRIFSKGNGKGQTDAGELREMIALQRRYDMAQDFEVRFTRNGDFWSKSIVRAEDASHALAIVRDLHEGDPITEANVKPLVTPTVRI